MVSLMVYKNIRTVHSLISTGFALALILILGVAILNPIETSLFWGVSALGTINITFYLIIILSYIIYLLFPSFVKFIKGISDILLFVSLLITLIVSINTTYNSQESWFLAFNYFIRNFGYSIGFVLGFACASVIGSIQILTAMDPAPESTNKTYLYPFIILISFFAFTILLMAVWRYCSMFILLIIMLVIATVSAMIVTILIGGKKTINTPQIDPVGFFKLVTIRPVFTKKNIVLLSFSAFFFFLFAGIGIYGIIDKSEILFFPGAPLPGTVRGFQIATVLAVVLFILAIIVLVTFELRSHKSNLRPHKTAKILNCVFANPIARIIKCLFEMLAIITGVYYFCIVIYLPVAFINIAIFGIIGSLIYYSSHIISEKNASKNYSGLIDKLLYSVGVMLFIICMILLLTDNLNNGVQYSNYTTSMSQEWFPFEFILQSGHYILMGIALGIIISYHFKQRFFIKSTDSSSGRIIGLVIAFFLVGLMTVGFTHAITLLNGAGDWPPTYSFKVSDIPFGKFFTITFTCGFAFSYILEILSDLKAFKPALKDSNSIKLQSNHIKCALKKSHPIDAPLFSKLKYGIRRFWVSFLLIAILLGSGIYIGSTFNTALSRDLLAQSSDFYIWTADSYEKIMPTSYIPTASYVPVSAGNIEVCKNEYGSLQIIWFARATMTLVSANVIESVSNDGNTIENANIRYASPLYDNSYPEILQPVIEMELPKSKHTSFWFDFNTAIDQASGVYNTKIEFMFKKNNGKLMTQDVYISISVLAFALPTVSHYYYNLPWTETRYTDSFYSSKRQFLNGGDMVNPLVNTSWYDEATDQWDYSKPLEDRVKENVLKNWGVAVETGMDLWNAWMDIAVSSLATGRTVIRMDYLTYIAKSTTGIGNPDNWYNDSWTGTAWFDHEREKLYSYYYFINSLLLSKPVNDGTLADWVIIKWKDEWDQPQFFPSSPSGRVLDRMELYEIYELEISEMVRARSDAVKAANASSGICLLANVNPTAVNMDILFDYFDIYCPLSYTITDELVNYCHSNGKTVWLYTCVQPFLPYANQFAYNQLYETHITQWQIYMTRTEGYWLWRSDYNNHSNYFYGFNGYLDGVFIYYPDGVKPEELKDGTFYTGIRFETATESIEETELFIMLENILLDLKSSYPNNQSEFDSILNEFDSKLRSIVKSMSEWSHDITKMRDFINWTRKEINTLYFKYYINQESKFTEVINSKWDTFNNPFNA
jgi:hypothetical protein